MGWFTDLIFSPVKNNGGVVDRPSLERDFLNKVVYEDVDFFHLNGFEGPAKVVKVYDADTVHCVFFINNKAYKFRVRLAKVDTAEKDSQDPCERYWCTRAVYRLEHMIDNKLVWLKCFKWDKYGRLLGELFPFDQVKGCALVGGMSFNQQLIKDGLGYCYDGGERQPFRDWAPWEAWLDYPEYRPSNKVKPVDNILDNEVFVKPVEGVDYKVSENVANKK